jgi:hypothetical protein
MEVVAIVWLLSGLAAALIWSSKGGSVGAGFLIGLVLGALGLIVVLVATPSGRQSAWRRECPHCKEPMRRDASVCPHCRRESQPWRLHEGRWWVEKPEGWYYLDDQRNAWVLHRKDAAHA